MSNAVDRQTLQEIASHVGIKPSNVSIKAILRRNGDHPHFVRANSKIRRERKIVKSYADRWLAGEHWPDIILDHDLLVLDGNHRLCAAILLGHTVIKAIRLPMERGLNGNKVPTSEPSLEPAGNSVV